MSAINAIDRLGVSPGPETVLDPTKQNPRPAGSFGDILTGMVRDVNDLQAASGEMRDQLVAGEGAELHQVMIAAEQAGVAMELLIEVRNKLLEAYQQLMRMPV